MASVAEGRAIQTSVLQSPALAALGVPHGFSTRHGGHSSGIFASLNFGNPGDLPADRRDPPGNIRSNWGVLASSIGREMPAAAQGLGERRVVEVHQVHGAAVCVVRAGRPAPSDVAGQDTKADAIVTDDPGRFVAIRVADCAPVLIASGDGDIVAAIHAGWRGVVAGAAAAAINEMKAVGADPGAMRAAVGPCIRADAFEVGPDVAAEFQRVFGAGTPHIRPASAHEKSLVDLKGAIRQQLLACGLASSNVDVLPYCTVRDGADFFSHRREKGLTGRMVGIIGPKAPGAGS